MTENSNIFQIENKHTRKKCLSYCVDCSKETEIDFHVLPKHVLTFLHRWKKSNSFGGAENYSITKT